MIEYNKLKRQLKILIILRWVSILTTILAFCFIGIYGKGIDTIASLIATISILYLIITIPIIKHKKQDKHDIEIIRQGQK